MSSWSHCLAAWRTSAAYTPVAHRTRPIQWPLWTCPPSRRRHRRGWSCHLALEGEPAFALVCPPGHHATANQAWVMCSFDNMAIDLAKKIGQKQSMSWSPISTSLRRRHSEHLSRRLRCQNYESRFSRHKLRLSEHGYVGLFEAIEAALEGDDYDIMGVSAGFDTYVEDWGLASGNKGLWDNRQDDRPRLTKCLGKVCDPGRRLPSWHGVKHKEFLLKNLPEILSLTFAQRNRSIFKKVVLLIII